MQALGKPRIGANPSDMLQCDPGLEQDGVRVLRDAVAHADSVGADVTRQFSDDLETSSECDADTISGGDITLCMHLHK